jgi:hypothetical protein
MTRDVRMGTNLHRMLPRDGGSAGTRTRDLSIKSRLLYQLSYGPSIGVDGT